MRDVLAVWRNTRAIVLVALTAGIYAAILIPFKPIPIVPGITELRPANVVPIVCSLLFGPAAAWGSANGNLIGDFFGTIGPGSIFGFLGNFVLGYLPYRLWKAILPRQPADGRAAQIPLFVFVTVVAGTACSLIITTGLDFLRIAPYAVRPALPFPGVFPIIALNNSLIGAVLGVILMPLLSPRARRWGLTAEDIHAAEDIEAGLLAVPGALAVIGSCAAGVLLWYGLSVAPKGSALAQLAGSAAYGLGPGQAGMALCWVVCLLGCALLARAPHRGRAAAEAQSADLWPEWPLVLEHVRFRYRASDAPALDDVSLSLRPGELTVLMGHTGAGKSSLCRCTNGLIPQFIAGDFAGAARVFGRDTTVVPVREQAGLVALVFQDFETQLFSSDLRLEIAFGLENAGVPREEMLTRVEEAIALAGLRGLEGQDPTTLSGGQKQRLAIAAAIALRPRLFVLDEPTTDLDPVGKDEVFALARRLAADGHTVLMAEHEPEKAAAADRLVALRQGSVAFDGPPAELLADPGRCREVGLLPPDLPVAFEALGHPGRPLTLQAAFVALQGRCRLDGQAWAELQRRDAARADAYGSEVVRVERLAHRYAGAPEPAVRDVDLSVRRGEFVAVLGRNGSGKTTLAKHLNGLLEPTEGRVTVRGRDGEVADRARAVGYVFQDPDHQIFCPTVREEVAFGPRRRGLPPGQAEQQVSEALRSCDLEHLPDADPFTLTKGERQRVAVASALACAPEVLVLDEPTTGLDGPQLLQMMAFLRRLNEAGTTVVIITHSMWAAATYAHRVVVLGEGRVVADGPAREVFGQAEVLQQAHLAPPLVAQVAQRLFGVTALTAEELAEVVRL